VLESVKTTCARLLFTHFSTVSGVLNERAGVLLTLSNESLGGLRELTLALAASGSKRWGQSLSPMPEMSCGARLIPQGRRWALSNVLAGSQALLLKPIGSFLRWTAPRGLGAYAHLFSEPPAIPSLHIAFPFIRKGGMLLMRSPPQYRILEPSRPSPAGSGGFDSISIEQQLRPANQAR